jgi:hypothetical protein
MLLRRLSVAVVLVAGLGLFGLARSGAKQAQAQPADAVEETEADGSGTHDVAAHRFRGNQSHHWRQVLIAKQ